MFLLGNAAACAKKGRKTPDGFYTLERTLKGLTTPRRLVGVSGTCMDARGIAETELAEGCRRSTLEELTDRTLWAAQDIQPLQRFSREAAVSGPPAGPW